MALVDLTRLRGGRAKLAGRPAPPGSSGRARLSVAASRAVSSASRALGVGSGATLGGRVLLALDPAALRRHSAGRRVILVSGTNGKTTTTRMLATALSQMGPVCSNTTGANLPAGLAQALVSSQPGYLCPLEVDEAWLAQVVALCAPEVICLLNLSRDQLDRNNEVRRLAGLWRHALSNSRAAVFANADDPLTVFGAGLATGVKWVAAGLSWREDAVGCPSCGSPISFDSRPRAGWSCPGCEMRRPEVQVWVEGNTVNFLGQRSVSLDLKVPGRANLANAAVALAVAEHLGADLLGAARSLEAIDEVAGRYSLCRLGALSGRLLLAKNPAGWLEVLELLESSRGPVLVAINARVADGRDPSWLWDVPFERLAGRVVVATGERARDLAVRLRYAGVEHLVVPEISKSLDVAGELVVRDPSGSCDPVSVVANYTAFQELRKLAQ